MYNCEILNMYDIDGSGTIEVKELQQASVDDLSPDDFKCVEDAWVNDVVIGDVCPSVCTPSQLMMIVAAGLALLYLLMR